MAVQATLRLGANQTGATGTLKRVIMPEAQPYFIEPQLNIFGALTGGEYVDSNGKTVTAPRIIKRKPAKSYLVENFTQQHLKRVFTVTTAATVDDTTVSISAADAAETYIYTLMQVAETGDVVYVNAAPNTTTGVLNIVRYTGSAAIDVGMHLVSLGQLQGENVSSLTYILRAEDNHYNYTGIYEKGWERSTREMAVDRYTGDTYKNDRSIKRREIMIDMEYSAFGSKRSSSIGANSATTPNGLEAIAATNGVVFDFEGTVERSEIRELGTVAGAYAGKNLIMATSIETASVIQSAMDDKLNVIISDIEKGSGIPYAKTMQFGPVRITFVPCGFYSSAGKEGQGLIFDADKTDLYDLIPLTLWEADDGSDHTQKTSKVGKWHCDGNCPLPADSGKHMVKIVGANAYAG